MILDLITDNPMLAVIAAGEIGFWVLIGAGLAARYLLRARTLGAVLLASTALVDLVVLIATVIDLQRGALANWSHGLAAAYIGMSVAFGRRMIRWADQQFAYRFAGGPVPDQPPKHGRLTTVLVIWFVGWPLWTSLAQPVRGGGS